MTCAADARSGESDPSTAGRPLVCRRPEAVEEAAAVVRDLLAARQRELPEKLLLLTCQLGRGLDHDPHDEVAAAPPVYAGHAPATDRELPPGLRAVRDDQLLGSVEGLVVERHAERGLAHRHVQVVDERGPL